MELHLKMDIKDKKLMMMVTMSFRLLNIFLQYMYLSSYCLLYIVSACPGTAGGN